MPAFPIKEDLIGLCLLALRPLCYAKLAKTRIGLRFAGGPMAEQKLAAAIKFDFPEDTVPQVVAAGQGALAEYIVEVAEEHGVTVYKDPPLARALGQLELGDRIPPALYRAVAEVLAFVYSLDQDKNRVDQLLQEV